MEETHEMYYPQLSTASYTMTTITLLMKMDT